MNHHKTTALKRLTEDAYKDSTWPGLKWYETLHYHPGYLKVKWNLLVPHIWVMTSVGDECVCVCVTEFKFVVLCVQVCVCVCVLNLYYLSD